MKLLSLSIKRKKDLRLKKGFLEGALILYCRVGKGVGLGVWTFGLFAWCSNNHGSP
jgi:hypothetical protein